MRYGQIYNQVSRSLAQMVVSCKDGDRVSVHYENDDKFDDENRIDPNKAKLFNKEIFCRVVGHPSWSLSSRLL